MPDNVIACEDYREDFSALIDGELSSVREAELRRHLDTCPSCSESVETLRGVDGVLAGIPLPEISADLRTHLEERIQNTSESEATAFWRRAPARRRPRLVGPAVGAALAIAASVAIYLAVSPEPARDSGRTHRHFHGFVD